MPIGSGGDGMTPVRSQYNLERSLRKHEKETSSSLLTPIDWHRIQEYHLRHSLRDIFERLAPWFAAQRRDFYGSYDSFRVAYYRHREVLRVMTGAPKEDVQTDDPIELGS